MTITISINATYPAFAALDLASLKKVAVGLGPSGMDTHWFVYNSEKITFSNLGDSGVSPAAMGVSYKRPVTFSRAAFGVFGNITNTDFNACRLATILADYVKKGVLKVHDDVGAVYLTPDQVLTFVP